MTELTAADLAALGRYDTPTICNALELVAPERRAYGFTYRHLHCPFPDLPPIVGYARTARIRSWRPSGRDKASDRDLRIRYYRQYESGPKPSIAVIQDIDEPTRGFGAFWGEVQTTVHKALGCLGTITDGCVRDIPMMAPGFQVLAASYAPSHGHVHLVDCGEPVTVAGMVVQPGDLIHADRHGAVVIPLAVARAVPDACELCGRKEAPILEAARKPGFGVDSFLKALSAAEDIH